MGTVLRGTCVPPGRGPRSSSTGSVRTGRRLEQIRSCMQRRRRRFWGRGSPSWTFLKRWTIAGVSSKGAQRASGMPASTRGSWRPSNKWRQSSSLNIRTGRVDAPAGRIAVEGPPHCEESTPLIRVGESEVGSRARAPARTAGSEAGRAISSVTASGSAAFLPDLVFVLRYRGPPWAPGRGADFFREWSLSRTGYVTIPRVSCLVVTGGRALPPKGLAHRPRASLYGGAFLDGRVPATRIRWIRRCSAPWVGACRRSESCLGAER